MVFDPSEVFRPDSFEDAAAALESPESRIVAGNTSLFSRARKGNLDGIKKLVDISKLGISYVREKEESEQDRDAGSQASEKKILVGAGTTFRHLAASPLINGSPEFAGLAEALNLSPPQIRNVATIGGSICSVVSFYDVPIILLALGATLRFFSKNEGEHFVPIDSFFQNPTRFQRDLLIEIQIPSAARSASTFVKLCRRMSGYAVVMTAAKISLDHNMREINEVRLAIGAMTKTPQRLNQLEEEMRHKEPSVETITRLCENSGHLVREITPSVHASIEYKKQVLPALMREAIFSAVERARER